MNFRDWLSTQIAPAPLQGNFGRAWWRAMGDALEALLGRVKSAVKARFPTVAPYDALPAIGSERGLERGIAESEESYRARLADAWTAWPYAGTAYGLLTQLSVMGYTHAYLEIVNGYQYTLDGFGGLLITPIPGGTWTIDSDAAFWSRFVVIFSPIPSILAGPLAGTDPIVTQLKRVIARWKPAHALCSNIVLLTSGDLWGFPTSHRWGDVGLVWGTGATTEYGPVS